jgi:hypothetical protein
MGKKETTLILDRDTVRKLRAYYEVDKKVRENDKKPLEERWSLIQFNSTIYLLFDWQKLLGERMVDLFVGQHPELANKPITFGKPKRKRKKRK